MSAEQRPSNSLLLQRLRTWALGEIGRQAADEIERLQQLVSDHGLNNLEDRDEYARCRSLSDEQIVREAMETPIRMVHELGNRYDVVCEKLERASNEPPAEPPGCNQCPHVIGDSYQRDCAYPDCSPAPPPGDSWTAVTERLPAFTEDQREFVLVYSETHDWMGTQFAVMRVADFYFYDPDCPEEMGTADADVVTHWKPLTGPTLTKEVR